MLLMDPESTWPDIEEKIIHEDEGAVGD
jgi:hypothetical protein